MPLICDSANVLMWKNFRGWLTTLPNDMWALSWSRSTCDELVTERRSSYELVTRGRNRRAPRQFLTLKQSWKFSIQWQVPQSYCEIPCLVTVSTCRLDQSGSMLFIPNGIWVLCVQNTESSVLCESYMHDTIPHDDLLMVICMTELCFMD